MQPGPTAFCLGRAAHPAQPGDDVCRLCGTLIRGTMLGSYQVQQLLGSGRSGKAYLAMHLGLRQPAAVKLFPPDRASMNLWESARREGTRATLLRHSSILPIFSCTPWHPKTRPDDSGLFDESRTASSGKDPYLLVLCQYAPCSLIQFLEQPGEGEVPGMSRLSRVLLLIQQVGAALSTAHERGIVHGALVPGNLLSDGQGRIQVADFGLARLHPPPAPYLAPELAAVNQRSVQSGNMALFWEAVTPASDQYTLAVLYQQLLTQILPSEDYKLVYPILQRAIQQSAARRFASIGTFTSELLTQLSRKVIPGGSGSEQARGYPQSTQQEGSGWGKGEQRGLSPYDDEVSGGISRGLGSSAPTTGADEWEKLGGKLFAAHDYEGAVQVYQRALYLDANKATLWLSLGDAYFALENYSEALKVYERAVALNPKDPQAWFNRGTVLDALGRRGEALACYERANQLGL
jgi:serine/threonine protein kinase